MKNVGKKKWDFRSSPFVLVLVLFILIVFARELLHLAKKYEFSEEKHSSYVSELEDLENRKEKLENKIEMLGTERGREEEIRDKFRVAREGEEMIIIIDNEDEEINQE